jgi:cell division protein FtsN
MVRTVIYGLVLANAGYFAWTQGWLMPLGLAPVQQAEPQRMTQQINPDAMRLLNDKAPPVPPVPTAPPTAPPAAPDSAPNPSADPVPTTSSAPAAPTGECLQAGLFTDAQANALRASLQGTLPEGSWAFSPVVEPGRWIIYMGRYANDEAVDKKRAELRARGVKFEALQNPRLNPGLSLGSFNSQAEADRELAKDEARGVRTARVMQERPEVRGQRLTVPSADAALKAQLNTLRPRLAGRALVSCK